MKRRCLVKRAMYYTRRNLCRKTTFSKTPQTLYNTPLHTIQSSLTVARSRRPSNSEHPGSMREHFPASKSSTALSPVYHPLCHNNNNNNTNNSNGIVNNGTVGGSPTGDYFSEYNLKKLFGYVSARSFPQRNKM